jgi:hypothetical protein
MFGVMMRPEAEASGYLIVDWTAGKQIPSGMTSKCRFLGLAAR